MEGKDALGWALSDPGFECSVLSEFRARLVAGGADHLLLAALRDAGTARGDRKVRGRQRTDATQVLGALRVLNRRERVAETLRAALNARALAVPDWRRQQVPRAWFERDGRRIAAWRRQQGKEARRAFAVQGGTDGLVLLECLGAPTAPRGVRP